MPDDQTMPDPIPQGRSYMWIEPRNPTPAPAPARPQVPITKSKPQQKIARPKMPPVPNMSRRLGPKLQRA